MKKIAVGILAHVDAGKTTLSEGLLYLTGRIKKLGRVDHRDTYLDTHDLERARGITIFSKQAILSTGSTEITLLDTPGHVDFSPEAERVLQALDYAILVISGTDGSRPTRRRCGPSWPGIKSPRSSSSPRWTWPARTRPRSWPISETGWGTPAWTSPPPRTSGTSRSRCWTSRFWTST